MSSKAVLQPQPDFQERELRKKRRIRKKNDFSKFDMSDLKKKLEKLDNDVIDSDSSSSGIVDSDSSGLSGHKIDNFRSNSGNDGGFYEGSGNTTPEAKSDESDRADQSDDSSDSGQSGLQTPPPMTSSNKLTNENKDNLMKSTTRLKETSSGLNDSSGKNESSLLSSLSFLKNNSQRTRTVSQ